MKEDILLNTKEKEREFDEKYAARILFLSFKYSQGNVGTQEMIFRYIHHLRPHWKITNNLEKTLTADVTKMAEKYLKNDTKHAKDEDTKGIKNVISTEVLIIRAIFNDDTTYIGRGSYQNDEKSLVTALTERVILRDNNYLSNIGRPRFPASASKQTSVTDPWMSQLCYYGFLGHATGLPEYDQMFQDIKEYVLENKKEMMTSVQNALFSVVRVWNQHHPEEQVSLEGS